MLDDSLLAVFIPRDRAHASWTSSAANTVTFRSDSDHFPSFGSPMNDATSRPITLTGTRCRISSLPFHFPFKRDYSADISPSLAPGLLLSLSYSYCCKVKNRFAIVLPTKVLKMSADFESFSAHLQSSKRILALLGAGISASSGLPTFRGAGGLWRTHDAVSLATPEAFDADPGLVWQFYSYRRHCALQAQPNRAHLALAELARKREGFMTLSQNVDGESTLMYGGLGLGRG